MPNHIVQFRIGFRLVGKPDDHGQYGVAMEEFAVPPVAVLCWFYNIWHQSKLPAHGSTDEYNRQKRYLPEQITNALDGLWF